MDPLEVIAGVLGRVSQVNHLKDVVVVGLEVLSEEVTVAVSAMEKLEKANVPGGFLIVAVAPGEGLWSSK